MNTECQPSSGCNDELLVTVEIQTHGCQSEHTFTFTIQEARAFQLQLNGAIAAHDGKKDVPKLASGTVVWKEPI